MLRQRTVHFLRFALSGGRGSPIQPHPSAGQKVEDHTGKKTVVSLPEGGHLPCCAVQRASRVTGLVRPSHAPCEAGMPLLSPVTPAWAKTCATERSARPRCTALAVRPGALDSVGNGASPAQRHSVHRQRHSWLAWPKGVSCPPPWTFNGHLRSRRHLWNPDVPWVSALTPFIDVSCS